MLLREGYDLMPDTTSVKEKWMEDYDVVFGEDTEARESTDFSRLFEQQRGKLLKEGEVLKGKVVSIGPDYVSIDIGHKQEGLVSKKEFMNYDGTLDIEEGQEVEVYLEKLESRLGNLILSKNKATILQAWDKISETCEKGESIEGTILSKVKGGLSVDIGVKAFLPGSQIDLKPIRQLDKYIGKTMEFKVIKFNKKRGNIVLSRRAILQSERKEMRHEILKQIEEGMIVKGVIKHVTDYGAFVDIGGIDGLLHITDMSWGRIKHPSNLITVGEEIEVKILKFDNEKERVSLGLKQVQENPWTKAQENYEIGKRVFGEILSIKEYGLFVELSEGIEGLVHISEMSWLGAIKNPIKHFNIGEKIEAQVLDVDVEGRRISLGLKQLEPNPWDALKEKYPLGIKVTGTIQSVVDFGIFVDIGEDIDALIHVSDISWTRKNINIKNEFNLKDTLEAVVLLVDQDTQKFCLGIKQLQENPWKNIDLRFPVGISVQATVIRVTDFGAFVEIESGLEGLIHISELSEENIEKPMDVVKKGDIIKAMIISVDKEAKKIALSMKSALQNEDGTLVNTVEVVQSATLGDKFKNLDIIDSKEPHE